MENKYIVYTGRFTYKEFIEKLSNSEQALMHHLFKHMTEDNLLYLYQKPSNRKKPIIEQLMKELGLSKETIQNKISKIVKYGPKNYFIQAIKGGPKGEYLVSPELAVKSSIAYETIYRSIIPRLEKQARLSPS